MKNVLLFIGLAVLTVGIVQAQEEPYQVPGFPPFAPAPTMLEVVEDKGNTVVVRHLMGETEVPKNPQRVYADITALQTVLSLGITPVGATLNQDWLDIPGFEELIMQTTVLGVNYEVNLEGILSVQPDLIIVHANVAFTDDAQINYQQLSLIAPTIVFNANAFSFWEEATRDLAEVLGRQEQAEAVLTEYRAHTDKECQRIKSVIGDSTLTTLQFGARDITLYGVGFKPDGENFYPYALSAWAYLDCQIAPGPEVSRLAGTENSAPLSFEVLPDLEADYLVTFTWGGSEADTALQDMTSHPLWSSIPAVQQNQVIHFERLPSSNGFYASKDVLTQAADAITGESE